MVGRTCSAIGLLRAIGEASDVPPPSFRAEPVAGGAEESLFGFRLCSTSHLAVAERGEERTHTKQIGASASMAILSVADVDGALPRIEAGLRKYCWIQDNFLQCDVSRDRTFQKRFNGFYKVRRNAEWQRHYYQLMDAAKQHPQTYAETLHALRQATGSMEPSFASKLVATLDPEKPIVDKYVLSNFGLRLPYHNAVGREYQTVQVYAELCRRYEALMGTPIAGVIYRRFAEAYPWAHISDLKKIDLVLWQTRS